MTGTGAADLPKVARAPIVGAQRPAGLQRLRHHLLDPLAADRISEERGAEQAVGQAGVEGGGDKRIAAGRRRAATLGEIGAFDPIDNDGHPILLKRMNGISEFLWNLIERHVTAQGHR